MIRKASQIEEISKALDTLQEVRFYEQEFREEILLHRAEAGRTRTEGFADIETKASGKSY